MSPVAKERREMFETQFTPAVKRLYSHTWYWEQELKKEIQNIISVCQDSERSLFKLKRQNQFLKNENDRLMEHVLDHDIIAVVMNSLYESGTDMLAAEHDDDIGLLNKRIETLQNENLSLQQLSDDVRQNLLNENFQLNKKLEWCQNQSLVFELELQNLKSLKSFSNDNEELKSQISKYEKDIAELQEETDYWQKSRDEYFYLNRKLDSTIQDKSHIIIDLKEKIRKLETEKSANTKLVASGKHRTDNTSKDTIILDSNMGSSTSPGLVIPSNVSRSKTLKAKKKNRNLRRKRENLKAKEVEVHPRNLNNNHVTVDLDCDVATCNPNLSVTNDVSRTSLSFNASCVFCHNSMLSGDHSKCVATSLLTRLKKLTKGKKSRPTIASI